MLRLPPLSGSFSWWSNFDRGRHAWLGRRSRTQDTWLIQRHSAEQYLRRTVQREVPRSPIKADLTISRRRWNLRLRARAARLDQTRPLGDRPARTRKARGPQGIEESWFGRAGPPECHDRSSQPRRLDRAGCSVAGRRGRRLAARCRCVRPVSEQLLGCHSGQASSMGRLWGEGVRGVRSHWFRALLLGYFLGVERVAAKRWEEAGCSDHVSRSRNTERGQTTLNTASLSHALEGDLRTFPM